MTNTTPDTSATVLTIPLVQILRQCKNPSNDPLTHYAVWVECLQGVFANQQFAYTVTDFVSAISQVWGAGVTGERMSSGIASLKNGNNQAAFSAPVINAAIVAMYRTFLIRDNPQDVGSNSDSPYYISPDIIGYEDKILTAAAAAENYQVDLNLPFLNSRVNNFYVRAKNISNASASGNVALYCAPDGLLLTPQSWIKIESPGASETFSDAGKSATIAAGAVCLTGTPFSFSGIPQGGHFCMIAVASGANGVPFPVPARFYSNGAQALWVQNNPNVSQRNINTAVGAGNVSTLSATLGNQNASSAQFIITVSSDGPGLDFPAGTTVTALITDHRLKGGQFAPPVQTWSSTGASFPPVCIPANINGSPGNSLMAINVTLTLPPGCTFRGMKRVDINYYQIPSSETDEIEQMVTREHVVPSHDNLGTTESRSLILLGTCTFVFPR